MTEQQAEGRTTQPATRRSVEDLELLGLEPARHAITSTPESLGALGVFAARVFLLTAPSIMLGAFLGTSMPANVVFAVPAVGVLLVAPRKVLLRMPISPALILLACWMGLSYAWSIFPEQTLFAWREDIAPVLGLVIVLGLLPVEESIKWLVRGFKVMIVASLAVVLLIPETRITVFEGEEQAAWEAYFVSKNQLGRSMLVAFLFLLILDKKVFTRVLGLLGAAVLILGSSSATAFAGVWFGMAIWLWAMQFRRVGREWTATYVVASVAAGITLLGAVFASAAWVVSLLGRDLSFSGRSGLWQPSLDFIAEKPWLGYGYRALFAGDTPETAEIWREIGFKAAHSHNGPLEVTLGLGVIGLALFFVVYVSTLTSALRYLKTHQVGVFAFTFLLLQMLVGFVEPVFLRDWLAVLVICRMLLLRIRLEDAAHQHELQLRVQGRAAMTLSDYSELESMRHRGRRGI